ncbi:hypothetical protein, partial [Coleofasciculus sp. LEGE 07092]|uniref:hypothetical protein n=1 Tax=Coleofasciculus sp. LEGE 07092 TaxID=2777969 RepID=UPI00188043AC
MNRFQIRPFLPNRQRQGRKVVIRSTEDNLPWRGNRDPNATDTTHSALISVAKDRRSGLWRWSLLWLTVLSIVGGTVTLGVLFLTQLPPPVDCQRISPLSADGERLYCAQLAAESGDLDKLVTAITLVQHWPRTHPLYSEAQRMLEEWSEVILNIAQQKINQGDQSNAVEIASQVPVSSPLYPEAQAQIATWQKEWQQGRQITSQFKDALVVQNWQQASQLITALSQLNSQYWNGSRVDALMQQLGEEKEAWQQLQEARDLAKTNQLAQLEEAIALAAKVNPSSYLKAEAQTELSKWSRTVLNIAASLIEIGNFSGGVQVAQTIPVNTSLYQEAQDWMRLGRAGKTAKQNNLLALVDALAAVRQIDTESPVQQSASKQGALWESRLEDRLQLLLARFTASFEQQTSLQMAIEQAALVELGRPQRVEAQTLIAQWRQESQEIDDRNHLRIAREIAIGGTIEQLRAAVDRASQIQLGQSLRVEAQTEIAKWNRQIQTIEDQPILDLARAFAQRRDLMGAISTASQIRPNRALYDQAQKEIGYWVAQVQTIQDRPILEAAAALAAQGRFDAAITTAAQISPERALYQQAQAAIAIWQTQLPPIPDTP